jgi:hypothetical protein
MFTRRSLPSSSQSPGLLRFPQKLQSMLMGMTVTSPGSIDARKSIGVMTTRSLQIRCFVDKERGTVDRSR